MHCPLCVNQKMLVGQKKFKRRLTIMCYLMSHLRPLVQQVFLSYLFTLYIHVCVEVTIAFYTVIYYSLYVLTNNSMEQERWCLLYGCCWQLTSRSNYFTAAEIESSVFEDHRLWILLSGDLFLMSCFSSPLCVGHETNWLPSPPKLTALVWSSLTLRLNRGYQRVTAVKVRV